MQTITQKKKLSKGTWTLIIILFVAVIAIAVAAALGYISLQFLADWLVGTMMFGSLTWINALIVIISPFALGIVACWVIFNYFKGQQVQTAAPNVYTPPGQTLSNPTQSDTQTVVN